MIPIWLWVTGSVVLVSSLSLTGLIFLSWDEKRLQKVQSYLVSFAVGGLLGDTFFHLLPESFSSTVRTSLIYSSSLVLTGFLTFFVLERFLFWHHHAELHVTPHSFKVQPVAFTLLAGDSIHNFIDGLLVAATFQVSLPLGLTTTLAVVLHEIPHEIGDFVVLVDAGLPIRKALLYNILSSLVALLGAAVVLVLGQTSHAFVYSLVPVTAGGFLYVTASDLIPELNRKMGRSRSGWQILCMLAGIGVMAFLVFLE